MTTKKHHADVIAQATEQFSDIYHGSSQGMYIFLDDFHYSLNDKLLNWLRYDSSDQVLAGGKSFLEKLIEPQSQGKLVEAYQAAMEHMTASELPVSWLTKSGKIIKTRVILAPISVDQHLLALHFITVK